MTHLEPGRRIGDYELLAPLGRGGFGEVWRAIAHPSGETVAVKFLTEADADATRRFEVEFRALGRINHPGCTRPIDFGTTDAGQPYLVTEFVDGVPLSAWATSNRSLADLLSVLQQIAAVLVAAHREGIVHRDLKPANIMVGGSDRSSIVKVLDFGIAKLVGREQGDITKTGQVIGTAGYMSPEQLLGRRDIGPPTDLYALGVIAFELLEGAPPFTGDSPLAVAMQHLSATAPPVRRDVPQPLRDLVASMLDKRPERRPTALAVQRGLEPSGRIPATAAPRSTSRPILAGAGALVLVCAALALALQTSMDDAEVPARPDSPLRDETTLSALTSAETPRHEPEAAPPSPEPAACPNLLPIRPGQRRLGALQDGALVYVPRGYSPQRRYPLMVFFHEIFQPPEAAFANVDFDAPGVDEYVWVFPRGNPHAIQGHWVAEGVLAGALHEVESVGLELCVDPAALYAIGHGNGGTAVEFLPCSGHVPVAAATFGHRRHHRGKKCPERGPTPIFSVFPVDDPVAPVGGTVGCSNAHYAPLRRHIEALMTENRCASEPPADEQCIRGSCEVPLEICKVPGGRLLEAPMDSLGELGAAARGCDLGPPSAFPFIARALAFFAEIRADVAGSDAPGTPDSVEAP